MGTIVIREHGKRIQEFTMTGRPAVVGRDAGCDICLASELVKNRHAALVERGGVVGLKELGRPGDTFVNGQRVQKATQIHSGDKIRIGNYVLEYQVSAESKPTAQGDYLSEERSASSQAGGEEDGSGPEDSLHDESSDAEDPLAGAAASIEQHVDVGEFYEDESSEALDIPAMGGERCQRLELSDELLNLIRSRLGLFAELDKLEEERQEAMRDEGLSDAVRSEFRRQTREAQQIPSADKAQASIDRVQQRIADIEQRAKMKEGEPLDPKMREALGMAVHQWELFVKRERVVPEILAAAKPYAEKEPLYAVLAGSRIYADELYGWAIYGLGLMTLGAQRNDSRKSMLNFLRRGKDEEGDRLAELRRSEEECILIMTWISRELAAIEKSMVEAFWKVYEQAALALVKGSVGKQEEVQLRALLRYGLIGCHPWFMPGDAARYILTDCTSSVVQEWDGLSSAMHVLHPDEYLQFVTQGKITPSIDEDLELNLRNTDEWRADKAWRRLVFTQVREDRLNELRRDLGLRVEELRRQKAEAENTRDGLSRALINYKEQHRDLSQKIQKHRVTAARFERAIARIDTAYLPTVREQREDAKGRLDELGVKVSRNLLVQREVKGIRRVSRLNANLRESFLPFVLRENFKPGEETVNDRESMKACLQEIEKLDPTLFKEALMPVKKRSHRIYLRYGPVMLLTPGCGFIGYSWNPRAGTEVGRLAMPAYCPRHRMRERILHSMLADFRWDTSKASAGVDLLTSDTLVAAYSAVRWEYRRKGKETREKAGLFNEENDRKNWRRHYGIYLQSAMDGGRKLFYKCYEIYDQVVIRYLDLPEGVERLRR